MDTSITYVIGRFLAPLTENTAEAYGTPLKHFCAYLAEEHGIAQGESAAGLTVNQAIGFAGWLLEQEYAKASIELYLTAIYRFYRFLRKVGMPMQDGELARLQETYRDARNIRGEPRPKDPKLEEVEAVIAAARAVPVRISNDGRRRQEKIRLRDIAFVESLRSTGCRIGELIGLRFFDLDFEVKGALVEGKGKKYRWMYWDERAWRALEAYRRARGVGTGSKAPVFTGHGNRSTGAALSDRHASRIVERLARRAGAELTAHSFRHVFATRALGKTGNLALVQDMLGHASPVTTRVYAKTDETQRQAAHKQVWD
jgi:site-specific recombinase XerD